MADKCHINNIAKYPYIFNRIKCIVLVSKKRFKQCEKIIKNIDKKLIYIKIKYL